MNRHSLEHLSDSALLREVSSLVAQDRQTTAKLLLHLAEVDARKLYLPRAWPSMYAYCVGELGMSEDIANKRIRAARKAREYPEIFDAIADGRLSLSAVAQLGSHLTPENARELLQAAEHLTLEKLGELIARHFPQPDMRSFVRALPTRAAQVSATGAPPQVDQGFGSCTQTNQVAATVDPAILQIESDTASAADSDYLRVTPEVAVRPVAGNPDVNSQHVAPAPARSIVKPLAPERYGMQVTISAETHDLLRRVQDLLGPRVAAQDLPQVLHLALAALVEKLEKSKLAVVANPREKRRDSNTPRHVPAAIRRVVWTRDEHRCTFVAADGRRCEATRALELDHVQELARGGPTTAANLRLRCRAHNQYTAERTFGVEFMAARHNAARASRAAQHPRAIPVSRQLNEMRAPCPGPGPAV